MSEIIRIIKNNLGLSTVSPQRRKIEMALARIEQPRIQHQQLRAGGRADPIDLPRICAVHDRPYMSRYIDNGKGFTYHGPIKFTPSIAHQYREKSLVEFSQFGHETCAWCGAEGYAAVRCEHCQAEICYGKTDINQMFCCRPSCGSMGPLQYDGRRSVGVRPLLSGAQTARGGK